MSSRSGCTHNQSAEMTKSQGVFRICYKRSGISLILLGILVFIALFVRDDFIRPFVGDVLVVVWLYSLLGSFWRCQPLMLAGLVYGIAFMVEISQYFQVLNWLGWGAHPALRVIFGATFDWMDLVAYFIGTAGCVIVEATQKKA